MKEDKLIQSLDVAFLKVALKQCKEIINELKEEIENLKNKSNILKHKVYYCSGTLIDGKHIWEAKHRDYCDDDSCNNC
jgi:hypothetical protein